MDWSQFYLCLAWMVLLSALAPVALGQESNLPIRDSEKTKEELLSEVAQLRQALAEEKKRAQLAVPVDDSASGNQAAEQPRKAPPTDGMDDPPAYTVTVVGSKMAAREMPGSAAYVSADDIRKQSYDDVNRALRRVPGVYLREEDGFGLFPNISLRGVDTGRSAKVTIMEDGVLSAPAPYAAPSAYYSPTAGRMSGIEVLKGSSQVKYGPHTTGGVINYLSTRIPEEFTAYSKSLYGSQNEIRTHNYFGDTVDTKYAEIGYLAEIYARTTDGYKEIDRTADFRDGGDTGFTNIEPMVKISVEPKTPFYNRIELKFGYTDREADETYLGLTEADFRNDPTRRYAATRFDNIDTRQYRGYLRYYIEPIKDLNITTTAYANNFARAWYKLQDVNAGGGNTNLSTALADGGAELDVLKGEAAGSFRVRNNNRAYHSEGIDNVVNYKFGDGYVKNDLTAGIRAHRDIERRYQEQDTYTQDANGVITDRAAGAPGSQANRREETEALAFFFQDAISIGEKLTVTPGFRYEHLWLRSRDYNSGFDARGHLDMFGGGLGVNYDFTDEISVFGSTHFGFSPPGPGAALGTAELEEETSLGSEIGVRYNHKSGFLIVEAIGFNTDFENLIVVDSIGGAGAGESFNGGSVRSTGVEFMVQGDPASAHNWGFRNPYYVTYTYTQAVLTSDDASGDAESLFSGGEKGNRVPYIPEHALSFGTSFEFDDVFNYFQQVSFNFDGHYVSDAFTTANNVSRQIDPDGDPDARFGKTDEFVLMDASLHLRFNRHFKLFSGAQNIFDKEYIGSRHPHGPRPGQPRFFYFGVELKW